LPRRAFIIDGGRQIAGIGGVRVPVAVNVPEGKNELGRNGE